MRRRHFLTTVFSLLAGCGEQATTPLPTAHVSTPTPALISLPTLEPTAPPPPLPTPSAPRSEVGGWRSAGNGVELRHMSAPGATERPAELVVVRLDPHRIRLRVHYDPEQPRPLRAWFLQYPALVMVNGGFFTEEYRTTALLISDGVAHGESYVGFGGMLSVDTSGKVGIQALRDQPYDAGQTLTQAVQSFPMLILPGGGVADIAQDGQRARRSVIAQDREGRLLLIVSPGSSFSLRELAEWLADSDLQIERALNLDGGSSSGLFVRAGDLSEQIDSFGALPIVIAVEANE